MIQQLIHFVQDYTVLVCLVGAFFSSTSMTLTLSALAGHGDIPVNIVFVFCALGNYCADTSWFIAGHFIGKKYYQHFTGKYPKLSQVMTNLLKKYGRHDWLLLIVVKFVYGIRNLTLVFLGMNRLPYHRFFPCNGVAVLMINAVLVYFGFLMGQGMKDYLSEFNHIQLILTMTVGVLLLYQLFKWLWGHWGARA